MTRIFAKAALLVATLGLASATATLAAPKVIVISLDSANYTTITGYLSDGTLNPRSGVGLLRAKGSYALQNNVIVPSLTAASHISIATGSIAIHNDIPSNTFHLVASPKASTISGFGAPIGGYVITPLGPASSATTPALTAQPLWVTLRAAGKKVVTATWPGGDGVDVKAPGVTDSPIIQANSPTRTVDYTVPFGAFSGPGGQGFALTASDFSAAPSTTTKGLAGAGKVSYSPVLEKTTPLQTFSVGGQSYTIHVAALDSTNDNTVNYDTLVFFDIANDIAKGITAGPFALPSTGPAYAKVGGPSKPFYLEGSSNRAGLAYYVTNLAPDLSTVRIAQYSGYTIPNPTAVASIVANVDDIYGNVGFWVPQPDFRFPERINSGLNTFPDTELEAVYEDQVSSFVNYQTSVALRAISQVPDADLAMIYIEQPDGSGHQFTLTDPRQASDFTDPNSIGANQDPAKVARYTKYRQFSYQVANNAVQAILKNVGLDRTGTPKSNVIVVSDHGMAPFHTSVNLTNVLKNAGIDTTQLTITTSGPSVHIYVNLQGRESGGTVSATDYRTLVNNIAAALSNFTDTNTNFNNPANTSFPFSLTNNKVFTKVASRPFTCPSGAAIGFCTSEDIGQDSGDVFAVMDLGYNFDGFQSNVLRVGDSTPMTTAPNLQVFSVSNFYGAHGYDPSFNATTASAMSAIFFAAGPNIKSGIILNQINNIDVAPTVLQLLGSPIPSTVDGVPLTSIFKYGRHQDVEDQDLGKKERKSRKTKLEE